MALMKNIVLIAKNPKNLGMKVDGKQFKASVPTEANRYQIKKLMLTAAHHYNIYEELEVDGIIYHIPLNIHNINKDNTDECIKQYAVGVGGQIVEEPTKNKPESTIVPQTHIVEDVQEEEPVVDEVVEDVQEEEYINEVVEDELVVADPVQEQPKQQSFQQQKKQFKQVKTQQQQKYNKNNKQY